MFWYVDVSAPDPSVVVLSTISDEIFCCSENLVVFLPATKVKQSLFLNHRNRKVAGGKHNVLVYMWMLVHPTYLMLSSATLSNDIFCCSLFLFLIKNHVFCECNNRELNFIPQPHEKKRGRRNTQCSSILDESWCTQLICCCPLQPFQIVVHTKKNCMKYFVPKYIFVIINYIQLHFQGFK